MGAEEVNYIIKNNATMRERIIFGLTGSINGDPSKIFRFNSRDMIGRRNSTVATVIGCYFLYKYFTRGSKKKSS